MAEPLNLPQGRASNTYQFIDGLTWQKGQHVLKMGVDIRHVRLNVFLNVFARGQFVYTGRATNHPVADLLLGIPTLTIGTTGDTHANMRSSSYNFYIQDDFRITNNLTFNYGLRYEYSRPATEASDRFTRPDLASPTPRFLQCGTEGIPRACQKDDKNNLAPRVGFAWSPSDSRTVVRAGYGLFYDVGFLNYSYVPRFNPPHFGINVFIAPSLANPFVGAAIPMSLLATVSSDFPQAYAQHWSLNLQQSLSNDFLLEVGYAGTKGTKLLAQRDLNQPRPGQSSPFPAYGPIANTGPDASSVYHGLLVRAERRFSDGLSFLASYTLSKSIDNASSWLGSFASKSVPQNSLDRGAERDLSDFDNRHRFVLSYVWELPFQRGGQSAVADVLISGWQLAGIFTFGSARPFTPLLIGTNDSNTNNSTGIVATGTDRPNQVGNPHLGNPDPAQWVNPLAFERPSGTFGDAGRNILRGPGFNSIDFALMKTWSFSETSRLQFRAEFFNLLNTPNFDLPVADLNSPNFGKVTSAKDSRQIQLGLRLEF